MGRPPKHTFPSKKIGVLIEKDILDKLDEMNIDYSLFFNERGREWVYENFEQFMKNRTEAKKRTQTPPLLKRLMAQKREAMKHRRIQQAPMVRKKKENHYVKVNYDPRQIVQDADKKESSD